MPFSDHLMPRITPLTFDIQLGRGERYDLQVDHGTGVFLLSGKISLHHGLVCLTEHAVAPGQVLTTEQSLTIEGAGWITLLAQEDSKVFVFAPQGILTRAGEYLGQWLSGYKHLSNTASN